MSGQLVHVSFHSILHPSPISVLPPFQDPTSPEAVDFHSRLAQYRREVKMVRQQSKNEEASDYNLLRTVLRYPQSLFLVPICLIISFSQI